MCVRVLVRVCERDRALSNVFTLASNILDNFPFIMPLRMYRLAVRHKKAITSIYYNSLYTKL